MKRLKILSVFFLSVLIFSCSSDDEEIGDPNAVFSATINGGAFSNYSATLGSYSATTANGLTIAVTDANNNVIRLFMNSTGGFSSGVVKEIGNEDGSGFFTTVTIRDQVAQITYSSISGSISILQNNDSSVDPSNRVLSGDFNIIASDNTGSNVTMTGSFSNIVSPGL